MSRCRAWPGKGGGRVLGWLGTGLVGIWEQRWPAAGRASVTGGVGRGCLLYRRDRLDAEGVGV
jgi:hypothetical protein